MIPMGKTASPSMIFHRYREPILESQITFGALCKFLKWPEERAEPAQLARCDFRPR